MEVIEIEPMEKEIIELIILDDERKPMLVWEWDSIYSEYLKEFEKEKNNEM